MSEKEMSLKYLATMTVGNIITLLIFGALPLFITAITSAIAAVNIKKFKDYDSNDGLKKSYKNMVAVTVTAWIGGFFMALASPIVFPFMIGFPMYILGFFIIMSGIVFTIVGVLSIVANVHIHSTDEYKNKEKFAVDAYKSTLAAAITCIISGMFSISYAFYAMITYYQRGGVSAQLNTGLDLAGKVGAAAGQPEIVAGAAAAKGVLGNSNSKASQAGDLYNIAKGTDTTALKNQADLIKKETSKIATQKAAQKAVAAATKEFLKTKGV